MNTLLQLNVSQKTVLLRVDFNVPVDDAGNVTDVTRIAAAKPTIDFLRQQQAKIVLMAHFGRPKGQVVESLRFKPIIPTISKVLETPVQYVTECIGETVQAAIQQLPAGGVLMLENIRFYPGEEKNDQEFAQALAKLGDVYVNDAFGTAHRAHASTEGLARLLPHAAGLLMQREVEELSKVLNKPAHPVVAIIGGAKISTKMQLITNLLPKVDYMLLGGALANTVLLAQNHKIGKSLVEAELAGTIKDLLSNKLHIPVDVVVTKKVETPRRGVSTKTVAVGEVEPDDYIVDIGSDTIKLYQSCLAEAKTVLWNGPMGVFEIPAFAKGTFELAKAVANNSAYSVLGGGETVSAIDELKLTNKISFISTGGGAMLEFLEGKKLPGIEALL
ncbi:MAG: phosphoglycerate kinase [Patescibacteria group bacterium]|jgi:phosphoglycerate kinase